MIILLLQGVTFGALTNSFGNTVFAQEESEFLLYDPELEGFSIHYPGQRDIEEPQDLSIKVQFIYPLESLNNPMQETSSL